MLTGHEGQQATRQATQWVRDLLVGQSVPRGVSVGERQRQMARRAEKVGMYLVGYGKKEKGEGKERGAHRERESEVGRQEEDGEDLWQQPPLPKRDAKEEAQAGSGRKIHLPLWGLRERVDGVCILKGQDRHYVPISFL